MNHNEANNEQGGTNTCDDQPMGQGQALEPESDKRRGNRLDMRVKLMEEEIHFVADLARHRAERIESMHADLLELINERREREGILGQANGNVARLAPFKRRVEYAADALDSIRHFLEATLKHQEQLACGNVYIVRENGIKLPEITYGLDVMLSALAEILTGDRTALGSLGLFAASTPENLKKFPEWVKNHKRCKDVGVLDQVTGLPFDPVTNYCPDCKRFVDMSEVVRVAATDIGASNAQIVQTFFHSLPGSGAHCAHALRAENSEDRANWHWYATNATNYGSGESNPEVINDVRAWCPDCKRHVHPEDMVTVHHPKGESIRGAAYKLIHHKRKEVHAPCMSELVLHETAPE